MRRLNVSSSVRKHTIYECILCRIVDVLSSRYYHSGQYKKYVRLYFAGLNECPGHVL